MFLRFFRRKLAISGQFCEHFGKKLTIFGPQNLKKSQNSPPFHFLDQNSRGTLFTKIFKTTSQFSQSLFVNSRNLLRIRVGLKSAVA